MELGGLILAWQRKRRIKTPADSYCLRWRGERAIGEGHHLTCSTAAAAAAAAGSWFSCSACCTRAALPSLGGGRGASAIHRASEEASGTSHGSTLALDCLDILACTSHARPYHHLQVGCMAALYPTRTLDSLSMSSRGHDGGLPCAPTQWRHARNQIRRRWSPVAQPFTVRQGCCHSEAQTQILSTVHPKR